MKVIVQYPEVDQNLSFVAQVVEEDHHMLNDHSEQINRLIEEMAKLKQNKY